MGGLNPQGATVPSPAPDSSASGSAIARKEQRRLEAEARQPRLRQRRELQRRVADLESEIHERETREKELVAQLENPETYSTPGKAVEINRELQDLHDRLPKLHTDWESAAIELERLQAES